MLILLKVVHPQQHYSAKPPHAKLSLAINQSLYQRLPKCIQPCMIALPLSALEWLLKKWASSITELAHRLALLASARIVHIELNRMHHLAAAVDVLHFQVNVGVD